MSRSKRRNRKARDEEKPQARDTERQPEPDDRRPPASLAPALVDEITRAAQEGNREQLEQLIGISASYSGPIPPPSLLKAYDAIVPGSADRIMRWSESQTEHRQRLEREESRAEIAQFARGQHYALAIGVMVVAGAVACAWLGHPWVSGVLSVAGFGAIGAPAVINLIRRE